MFTVALWFGMPVCEPTLIQLVCGVPGKYIKRQMFEAKFASVDVSCSYLRFDIDEHNEIGFELLNLEIAFALALREIDMVFENRSASLHLYPKFLASVGCLYNQIAAGKV